MDKKGSKDAECPLRSSSKILLSIEDALDMINGKWRIKVISALLDRPKRFKEMSSMIDHITDRMLSIELKKLELNLLIEKKVAKYSGLVEYELTDHGKSLKPLITELIIWGEMHRKKVIGNLCKKD